MRHRPVISHVVRIGFGSHDDASPADRQGGQPDRSGSVGDLRAEPSVQVSLFGGEMAASELIAIVISL